MRPAGRCWTLAAASGMIFLLLEGAGLTVVELSVTVHPRRVELGERVATRGRGCAPGDLVRLRLSGPGRALEDSVMADEAGAFSASMILPQDLAPGRARLHAQCHDESGTVLSRQQSLLIVRPPLVIHLVNLMFGLGAFLVVFGIGWDLRNRSKKSRLSRQRR